MIIPAFLSGSLYLCLFWQQGQEPAHDIPVFCLRFIGYVYFYHISY